MPLVLVLPAIDKTCFCLQCNDGYVAAKCFNPTSTSIVTDPSCCLRAAHGLVAVTDTSTDSICDWVEKIKGCPYRDLGALDKSHECTSSQASQEAAKLSGILHRNPC